MVSFCTKFLKMNKKKLGKKTNKKKHGFWPRDWSDWYFGYAAKQFDMKAIMILWLIQNLWCHKLDNK